MEQRERAAGTDWESSDVPRVERGVGCHHLLPTCTPPQQSHKSWSSSAKKGCILPKLPQQKCAAHAPYRAMSYTYIMHHLVNWCGRRVRSYTSSWLNEDRFLSLYAIFRWRCFDCHIYSDNWSLQMPLPLTHAHANPTQRGPKIQTQDLLVVRWG